MNLFAVVAAILFMLIYAVPSIRGAAEVEKCVEIGGRYDHATGVCKTGG
ncbi:hypothetical protein NBRC116601_30410 [Cognatishimia sp. WU-CL00825]